MTWDRGCLCATLYRFAMSPSLLDQRKILRRTILAHVKPVQSIDKLHGNQYFVFGPGYVLYYMLTTMFLDLVTYIFFLHGNQYLVVSHVIRLQGTFEPGNV